MLSLEPINDHPIGQLPTVLDSSLVEVAARTVTLLIPLVDTTRMHDRTIKAEEAVATEAVMEDEVVVTEVVMEDEAVVTEVVTGEEAAAIEADTEEGEDIPRVRKEEEVTEVDEEAKLEVAMMAAEAEEVEEEVPSPYPLSLRPLPLPLPLPRLPLTPKLRPEEASVAYTTAKEVSEADILPEAEEEAENKIKATDKRGSNRKDLPMATITRRGECKEKVNHASVIRWSETKTQKLQITVLVGFSPKRNSQVLRIYNKSSSYVNSSFWPEFLAKIFGRKSKRIQTECDLLGFPGEVRVGRVSTGPPNLLYIGAMQ